MTQVSRILVVAFTLAVGAAACSEEAPVANADLPGDLQVDLEALRAEIEEADRTAEQGRPGLLGEIADTRREVLLLSAAMLENRLIAEQGGVPTEVVARISTPDPRRAELLLRHIAAAEEELEETKHAAAERDGMADSLSQTAIATQELTIAQLRQAYFEAAHGLALPGRTGAGSPTAAGEVPPLTTSAPPPAEALQGEATPPPDEPAARAEPPAYDSDDYARIQRLLTQSGFEPGPVDGEWGPRTRRALIAFQRSVGLPPTGEPDPQSMDALGFD